MKDFADAMAAEHIYDRIAVFVSIFLNNRADIAEACTRPDNVNAAHHALISHFAQTGRFQLWLAGIIHAAGIAVPPVNDCRHVNIQNIAVRQFAFIRRNTVADDMVD